MSSEPTIPPIWRAGAHEFSCARPVVMGILNVTPDSFSDGGSYATTSAAIKRGIEMIAEGADIIDIGGESTRPGSDEVDPEDELARVLPVLEALAPSGVPVSVDTRHALIARACTRAGASVVNDVSGFRDPAMVEVAAESGAGLIVMHMLGEPKTMQSEPHYNDVVAEVRAYLLGQAAMLEAAGVAHGSIMLDPGMGFGKTTAHNLELLARLTELADTGYPLMMAASRKRFIGDVTGVSTPAERVHGSVAVAVWSVLHGACAVRVHDVAATVQALKMIEAIGGAR